MSSSAANAYARVATTTASPRDIEAQTLLKAANKLQDAINANNPFSDQTRQALMYNRKLWTIFLSEAMREGNPQPVDVRQKIANIGVFVMKQTVEMQVNPDPAKLKSLIEINCNLAAGLSGRG